MNYENICFSQIICVTDAEILDIENVRIDTKIESTFYAYVRSYNKANTYLLPYLITMASLQPEISEIMRTVCMTLSSKVKSSRYVIYFIIKNVRFETKIMSV